MPDPGSRSVIVLIKAPMKRGFSLFRGFKVWVITTSVLIKAPMQRGFSHIVGRVRAVVGYVVLIKAPMKRGFSRKQAIRTSAGIICSD